MEAKRLLRGNATLYGASMQRAIHLLDTSRTEGHSFYSIRSENIARDTSCEYFRGSAERTKLVRFSAAPTLSLHEYLEKKENSSIFHIPFCRCFVFPFFRNFSNAYFIKIKYAKKSSQAYNLWKLIKFFEKTKNWTHKRVKLKIKL